jgi:hypothetical protein
LISEKAGRLWLPAIQSPFIPGVLLGSLFCVSSQAQTPAAALPSINTGAAVDAANYAKGAPLAPGSFVAVYGNFVSVS